MRDDARRKVPPLSFAHVSQGILRSAYPMPVNFSFLETLQLRTIVCLSAGEEMQVANMAWADEHGVEIYHFRMPVCKEPFVENDEGCIRAALQVVLSEAHQPVLCHSDKGKHRVGVLIGCLRKTQKWSLASIFNEYDRFSGGKGEADLEFIESFLP